jgi:hypothetical protein
MRSGRQFRLRHCQIIKKTMSHPILISIILLIGSNVFMTFAWYAHLKELADCRVGQLSHRLF